MLRWSAADLAAKAGLSLQTILRVEKTDGVPTSRGDTLSYIEEALQTAGIEFIGGPTDAPGVRLHVAPGSRPSS